MKHGACIQSATLLNLFLTAFRFIQITAHVVAVILEHCILQIRGPVWHLDNMKYMIFSEPLLSRYVNPGMEVLRIFVMKLETNICIHRAQPAAVWPGLVLGPSHNSRFGCCFSRQQQKKNCLNSEFCYFSCIFKTWQSSGEYIPERILDFYFSRLFHSLDFSFVRDWSHVEVTF